MGPTSRVDESSGTPQSNWAFPLVWALGLMLLVLATWPLWFPGSSSDFPMIPLVPLIPSGSSFGAWVSQLLSAAMAIGLARCFCFPNVADGCGG